jgi:hypothetical protein
LCGQPGPEARFLLDQTALSRGELHPAFVVRGGVRGQLGCWVFQFSGDHSKRGAVQERQGERV